MAMNEEGLKMKIKISIPECSINNEYQYMSTLRGKDEKLEFPLFTIGRDSYVIESYMEINVDSEFVCNVHIGRYSSIARDTVFMVDQNHDHRRVCQGRISGGDYLMLEFVRRNGQIVIMNDCWIGEASMIMSGVTIGNGAVIAAGSVVNEDVPAYAIVAGNPAKIIGYRFSPEQIRELEEIRWWNWDEEKVRSNAKLLNGDVDEFIKTFKAEAKQKQVKNIDIPSIPARNQSGRRYLYIPDFEQDYPTYQHVMESFARSHEGSDDELLLFVRDDEYINDKLEILNILFERYSDVNCFVNLFEGSENDLEGLIRQSDYYITNRNKDVVYLMDMADKYGVKVLSGVDIPVFEGEKELKHIVRTRGRDKHFFNTLIVITPQDCKRLLKLYPRLVDGMRCGEISFVGTPEVGEIVNGDPMLRGRVSSIDENSIIPFDEVHSVIKKRMTDLLAGRELPRGITGWYYQQFLKMQYANLCEDEYYMAWDGDTILCGELNMFDEKTDKPYLDLKQEYHKEYFDTLEIILPEYKKAIKKSFISEHMLFKTSIMRQLIADIEANDKIPGTKFWEKIINAIPEDKIQSSAFSEFETYGTYAVTNYPDEYVFRNWHSFRLGGAFYSVDTISDRDFKWLSKDFSSISFEKGHTVREDNANLFDNPYYQEKLTPRQMLEAAQMEYTDGYKEVWDDDAEANVLSGQYNNSENAT